MGLFHRAVKVCAPLHAGYKESRALKASAGLLSLRKGFAIAAGALGALQGGQQRLPGYQTTAGHSREGCRQQPR